MPFLWKNEMSKLTFTTDIHLDEQSIQKELSERFQSAARQQIHKFFNETRTLAIDAKTGIYGAKVELGAGL